MSLHASEVPTLTLILDESLPQQEQKNIQTILRARGFQFQVIHDAASVMRRSRLQYERAMVSYQEFDFRRAYEQLRLLEENLLHIDSTEAETLLKKIFLLRLKSLSAQENKNKELLEALHDMWALFGESAVTTGSVSPDIYRLFEDVRTQRASAQPTETLTISQTGCQDAFTVSIDNSAVKTRPPLHEDAPPVQVSPQGHLLKFHCGPQISKLWISSEKIRTGQGLDLHVFFGTEIKPSAILPDTNLIEQGKDATIATDYLLRIDSDRQFMFTSTGEKILHIPTPATENGRLIVLNKVANTIQQRELLEAPSRVPPLALTSPLTDDAENNLTEQPKPAKWIKWAVRSSIVVGGMALAAAGTFIILSNSSDAPQDPAIIRELQVTCCSTGGGT